MPPAPLLRTARIPESTIPRALCAAGQRRGPVVPASVHRSAAALPGSAVDRARVAPGSESSGPPGKSTRVGASSARGRVSGLRAHTVDWRAARRPPAIPGAPSRVRPESALGSTQCACPSPPRPSRPPTLCRRGSFFLESVVLCAPWVMTSWDASLLAERAFLYGVVTRISTETNTHSPTIHFTFLGYTFRPRKAVDKYGRVYVNFSPGVSREALRAMRQTVRGWHLQLMNDKELSDLSKMFGPVIRGWANYYGRFHSKALKPLWRHVNDYLVRWMRRKHKHLARGVTRAARALARLADSAPRSFVHWEWGFVPAA